MLSSIFAAEANKKSGIIKVQQKQNSGGRAMVRFLSRHHH
jgi:hypothetical protein